MERIWSCFFSNTAKVVILTNAPLIALVKHLIQHVEACFIKTIKGDLLYSRRRFTTLCSPHGVCLRLDSHCIKLCKTKELILVQFIQKVCGFYTSATRQIASSTRPHPGPYEDYKILLILFVAPNVKYFFFGLGTLA